MRGQFLYTHVRSRAMVWSYVTNIVTQLIPFVFSAECGHWKHWKSKHQLCKLLASVFAYWRCIKQWPLGEWPTRCLPDRFTCIQQSTIVLNRGRPIGPSDCNNDHIQRFIKITNMVKKSPLKKLVHTCGGLVSSGLYWFSYLLNINVPGIL